MFRKGMELSINFVVMLILSLVMLIGGLWLLKNFFTEATDFSDRLSEQTDAEIERMLTSGQRVAVYPERISAHVGKSAQAGVGILNVLGDNRHFNLFISFDEAYNGENKVCDGYTSPTGTSPSTGDYLDCSTQGSNEQDTNSDGKCENNCEDADAADGSVTDNDNPNNWLTYTQKPDSSNELQPPFIIQNNHQKKHVILVQPPRGAKPATYIFNVYVLYDNAGDDTNFPPPSGSSEDQIEQYKSAYFNQPDGEINCDDIAKHRARILHTVGGSHTYYWYSFSPTQPYSQTTSLNAEDKRVTTTKSTEEVMKQFKSDYERTNSLDSLCWGGTLLSNNWDKKRLYSGSVHKLYVVVS